MKSNARSSKLIRRGVRPCRLCSEAIASTVAQIAFEQEATRRVSDTALLPRSSSRTTYPRRMTTAAKGRSSDRRSHARSSASLSGSMPARRRMESGSSSFRQPPADSGGGKYVLADGSGLDRGEVSSFSFA